MSPALCRRSALAAALAAAGLLLTASIALAGTINYTVQASSLYTIQDNGNGIVKVNYNGCVVAGVRQTLNFQLVTNVSADSNATFNILKAEGQNPTATFTPASVYLRKGDPQTFQVGLGFTLTDQNNGLTTFRIKLDPDSGEGLGQGAGIMVSIPCVLAANTGGGGAGLPPVGSTQARGPASCVSEPRRLRLRARVRTSVVTRVVANGQRIQGAVVRVSGPGVHRQRRTNRRGEATFSVRPNRKGTLVIQSNVCLGADRVAVRAALAAGPQFTG